MSVRFLPPRLPMVDPKTGIPTREWYLLLSSLFAAGGSGNVPPPSLSEIMQSISELVAQDAEFALELGTLPPAVPVPKAADDLAPPTIPPMPAIDNLTPPPLPLFVPIDDVLPVINVLWGEIAALQRRLDDLAKGTVVL